ncbi:MAG: hypothetical protein QOD41_4485 [Cryptosporangiaceae bacterium]|jgi:hypothetical protein|nr:hypothetical protein [Cryptosporangiaceae bacterium]
MPVAQSVRDQVKKLLPEGDEIRYLIPATYFPAMGENPGVGVFVVVGEKAITVVSSGFFRRDRPKNVIGTYKRSTRLGPVDGATPSFTLNGSYYEVDDEYIAAVNAADAELAGAGEVPADPFPEL